MEDSFDPSKEGRRVVSQFGRPNTNQITEERQRHEESEAKAGRSTRGERS